MGAATSYELSSYTDKYELDVTTQTVSVYSFAFEPSSDTTQVVEITGINNYVSNWTVTKSTGTAGTLIFQTKDGTAKVIGSGDTQHFFAFINEANVSGGGQDLKVYYVTDTNATIDTTANSASDTYSGVSVNDFTMTFNAGQGSGDPHIMPYINPYNTTLLLPHTDNIINYFALHTENEILTINAETWHLSLDRIVLAEEIRRDLTMENKPHLYTEKKHKLLPEAIDNITKYPIQLNEMTDYDVSFNRYVTINYNDSTLTIDMETLTCEQEPLKNTNINVTEERELTQKNKSGKIRSIFITTSTIGIVRLDFIRRPERLNHRNDINIIFGKELSKPKALKLDIKGALMHPDKIYNVPKLTSTDLSEFKKEPTPQTLKNYITLNKQKLKQHRYNIRNFVRSEQLSSDYNRQ